MKRIAVAFGISGVLLLTSACSDDPASSGNGGAGGSPAAGAASGGAGSGGTSGATAAGASGGGAGGASGTGGGAGGASGGGAGGSAGGGSGGAGGASGGGAGGVGGAGGGASCVTTLGKALQFDGSKVDILSANLGADLPGGNSNRTIELWAKFTGDSSWTAEGTFLETGKHVTAGNQILGLDMSGRVDSTHGRFGPYTNGLSDNNGGMGVVYEAPGNAGWLHIAWSFDTEKGLSFTVNGDTYPVQMGGTKLTLDFTPGIVTLGASQNFGSNGWTGVMDEVKIWKVSKTPAEIKANMRVVPKADAAGLVAYYRFNEGQGTDVADEAKSATHTLKACTAKSDICPEVNAAAPSWVDSDVPGTFTCAP